jgi:hypothetical protein
MYPHAFSKYSPPYVDNRPPALAGYYGKKRRKKRSGGGVIQELLVQQPAVQRDLYRNSGTFWRQRERENRRLFIRARNQVETLLFYS